MHDDHDHEHQEGSQDGAAVWLDRVNEAYYDRLGEGMGARTRDRINWMCAQCEGDSVLDIGCSQGITSLLLGREGFRVRGVDIMQEAVDYARNELALESSEVCGRVAFERMDLLSIDPGDRYDNVILGEVVEHQTSAGRFLRAALRHVAPGGRMIVTVPFGLNPFPDHKCTVFPRDIVDALDGLAISKFEVVEGYIRVVAVRREPAVGPTPQHLLAITEAGTIDAQRLRFEALASSRAAQTKIKELAEKLATQVENSRRQLGDATRALTSARDEASLLRNQLLALRNEALTADGELQRAGRLHEAANAALQEARKGVADALAERDDARVKLKALATDLEAHKRKITQMRDYRRRLEHQHDTLKSWLKDAGEDMQALRDSTSFRLGYSLVKAARSPREFVALPVRLGRLFFGGLRRRVEARKALADQGDAKEGDPALAWGHDTAPSKSLPRLRPATAAAGRHAPTAAGSARPPQASDVMAVALPADSAPMLPPLEEPLVPVVPAQPLPDRVRDMRVAAVMDDFTRESFRHCCQLMQVTPDGWRAELESFRPHLLLVESAWKGEGGVWARKIYPLSEELVAMIEWARQAGIPTAFWNKEDPVHFSVFLPTARLFDHVFTTDIDCIKGYRRELGHDRVHLLPFACEPTAHNPIEAYERKDAFCFAGSYYVKYPERQRDFSAIVDALQRVSRVEIYDRNHGQDEPSLRFPNAYVPLILGSLPYGQIDRAYKGYRYGININTVKQSQSMFARRAFELLASNTVTVSNFSRGLRLMFGELVISSDNGDEVTRRLAPLLHDEQRYRKHRLLGLRKVMLEHTYADRMAFVAGKVSGTAPTTDLPAIAVIARAASDADLEALLRAYRRQRYPRRSLYVVPADGFRPVFMPAESGVHVLDDDAANPASVQAGEGGFLAVFDAGDYYGAGYLEDLAAATRYAHTPAIGKRAIFLAGNDGVRLQNDGSQYAPTDVLELRCAIVRADALHEASAASLVESGRTTPPSMPCLAVDEFNYCRGLRVDACAEADDLALDLGLSLERLQAIAEADGGVATDAGEAMFTGFGPEQLARLFEAREYAEGRVVLEAAVEGMAVSSKLSAHKSTYVYANAPLPIERLFPGDIGRFNMLASSDMLLSITLIFLDSAFKRLGHVIRACNSNQAVVPLEGTCYVMLGVRVQGSGQAVLRKLVLQHVPPGVDAIAGAGRHLVVSRSYPSYGDLYNYTFVHRRLQAYHARGVPVDVFRFSNSPLGYEEFEGIDVVGGNVGDLALMLRSNDYRSILVHSFDEQVWSAVEPFLEHTSVVVWVHGAEIQPWYRRDFNNADEGERRRAIQRSDMRLGLWRRVLEDMPPNLHLVFVSEFLARQAMKDLGIEIPSERYSVIHNVVDGEAFPFVEKSPDQRHRVLSIRPYTKRTYANDLAVRAILDLAGEPWFGEMEFSVYGDGPLFDETVAPLREGFPNVRLEKRFLTQAQIYQLHREHGVFLVPSRIDSQGVSRDEAMAAGLVPVTNRVSAIPEFVDDAVGVLVAPEDWRGLADGIRALHDDPDRFMRMSAAAAVHVRAISGPDRTIEREVALIEHGETTPANPRTAATPLRRIAVYGDLNVNLMDGSAVWAASLVQVLAGVAGVEVDFYLKARLSNTRLIEPLLALSNVRLVEPAGYGDIPAYQPAEAVVRITDEDRSRHYDAIVLRGHALCLAAARDTGLRGRLWTYLTDIPQQKSLLDEGWRHSLSEIAGAARFLLCQTAALEDLLQASVPAALGKTRRLPPMVPAMPRNVQARGRASSDGVLRIVYAGKFASLWGVREMLDAFERLRDGGKACELHVFGDKIHNHPEDPSFRDEVKRRLSDTPGVTWYGAMPRSDLLARFQSMDLGWAWRNPELESTTLELSTKVLEYGQCGLPVLMAPGPANQAAFGRDYPLFAATPGDLDSVLSMAAGEPGLLARAATRSGEVAQAHTFDVVRAQWITPLFDNMDAEGNPH